MSISTTVVPSDRTLGRIPHAPSVAIPASLTSGLPDPVPALPARPIAHPRSHKDRPGRCPACELRDYLEG